MNLMAQKNDYIIMKSSRLPALSIAKESDAYAGLTCKEADIQPRQIYTSIVDAQRDAQRLTELNPVGFTVWAIGQDKPTT